MLLLDKGACPACSNTGRSAAIVRTYYTTPLMTRLAKAAVELFEGMTEELGRDGGFRQTGFTQIVPPEWVADARRMVAMHQEVGIDTRIVQPSDYGRIFPWLNPEGVGLMVLEVRSGKESFDNDFALEVLDLMAKRIPSLEGARIVGGYAALYDTTPDWMPFFGPRRELAGYYDACGGGGHAFKTGPIMARELADWLLDDTVEDDFRRLGFDRVADGRMFVSTFGGNRG